MADQSNACIIFSKVDSSPVACGAASSPGAVVRLDKALARWSDCHLLLCMRRCPSSRPTQCDRSEAVSSLQCSLLGSATMSTWPKGRTLQPIAAAVSLSLTKHPKRFLSSQYCKVYLFNVRDFGFMMSTSEDPACSTTIQRNVSPVQYAASEASFFPSCRERDEHMCSNHNIMDIYWLDTESE